MQQLARSVARDVAINLAWPIDGKGQIYPDNAILYYDVDEDAHAELTCNKNPFFSSVLPTQYNRQADGKYKSTTLNMLTNSGFVGAVSGTPGTAPTGWTQISSGGSIAANGDQIELSVSAAQRSWHNTISVQANTAYVFACDVDIKAGENVPGNILRIDTFPSGSVVTIYVDGIEDAGATNITLGKHKLSRKIVVGSTAGTMQVKVGLGLSTLVTGTVTISNPQLTEGPIARPYVLSPVSSPAYGDVVDVINGEKWLRTCGAVTNLLASGSDNLLSWAAVGVTINPDGSFTSIAGSDARVRAASIYGSAPVGKYTFECDVEAYSGTVYINVTHSSGAQNVNKQVTGPGKISVTVDNASVGNIICYVGGFGALFNNGSTIKIRNPILTFTAYPVPYTPPGTTMPASHATTTGGPWFVNPEGSPVWNALSGGPMTLATRVRMGVGSGDLVTNADINIVNCAATQRDLQYANDYNGDGRIVRSYDGVAFEASLAGEWNRNAIISRITQVNTAGTQFRVGHMIEGTHTTIQWSSWVAFDGSFNPSTLFKLMLGYNNIYPMWFSKIIMYRAQIDDAKLIADMGA